MPIWSSVDDVRARVTYAEITPTSQPSETQVEDWLDDAEAEVRAALRSVELRDTYDPTDDADALRILRRRVVDFAAGLTKLAWASADGDAENEDGQPLVDAFNAWLQEIAASPARIGAMLQPTGQAPQRARQARSHTTADGEVSEPRYSVNNLSRAL